MQYTCHPNEIYISLASGINMNVNTYLVEPKQTIISHVVVNNMLQPMDKHEIQ